MPDTPATRTIVIAAWQKLTTEKYKYLDKVPGTTRADIDSAAKKLRDAIAEWESPGEGEPPKQAEKDRKRQKSFMGPILEILKSIKKLK